MATMSATNGGTPDAPWQLKTPPGTAQYGTKKGIRGRFAMYVPPVLEVLGLAEVEHAPKNTRMRAKA
jgi:hypothetical protein